MSSRAFDEAPSQDMRKLICRVFLVFSSPRCGTYVVAGAVVDGGLAEHGVVLELGLAERRSVAGLKRKKGIWLVFIDSLDIYYIISMFIRDILTIMTSFALPLRRDLRVDLYPRVTLPDFMTSARRELMLLASFLFFLGAIVTVGFWCLCV